MLWPNHRRRRFVLAAIAISLTLLIGGGAFVQLRTGQSWSAMQQQTKALQQAWRQQQHRREPLWGAATPDRAFGHYERALQLASALKTETLKDVRQRPDEHIAADSVAVLQAWQPVLESLRAGAHASDNTPPSMPTGDAQQDIASLLSYRWITNAAVLRARVFRLGGRHREAVQDALDAATFSADLLHRGMLINQMIATATLAICVLEAWSEPALSMLDPGALELLATGLERLDRSVAETVDQTGELLFLASSIQRVPIDPSFVPTPSAWRYGFSTHWMLADAFTLAARSAEDLARSPSLAWPQRAALLEAEQNVLVDSGNPATILMAPNLRSVEENLRQTIAHLRLLRMSVAMHRGLNVPPLRDPLGDGPLRVTPVDGGVRLHSAAAEQQKNLERIVAR